MKRNILRSFKLDLYRWDKSFSQKDGIHNHSRNILTFSLWICFNCPLETCLEDLKNCRPRAVLEAASLTSVASTA
jgi:hypothetical protein